MVRSVKAAFRAFTTRFGYGVFDLRKDQSPTIFLGGHLRALFERLEINCVIDVGANIGQYGALIRQAGYTGRVLSIEPIAAAYGVLRDRARRDGNWQMMNIALGDKDETRVLNIFADDDLSSFLAPSVHMAQAGSSPVINTEVVTVRRLAEGMADDLAMLAYYRGLGFQPTGLFPVAHDRKTGHVFEFDAVFARRDVS